MTEHDRINQLAALLDGDDVPAAPSSLTALADLATRVRDHAELLEPTPEFRSALRAELVAAAQAPPGLVERARTAWRRRTADLRTSARVAVATMTASSMIGSAGVAVAAQEALPRQLLYGLKGLTEDARLAMAADDVAEARLHLVFARERLQELRATAGQLDTDEVVALLAEMDAHSEAGAEAMLTGVSIGAADADEVRRFTSDQRDGLVGVLDDLPLLAKPVAEDSLELLRRIEVTATGVTPAATDCDCDRERLLGSGDTARAVPDEGTARSRPAPNVTAVDVSRPGAGPAVPMPDCDCIELPGGSEAREEHAEPERGGEPEASQDVEDDTARESPQRDEASDDAEEETGQDALQSTPELTTPDATPDTDDDKRNDDRIVDAPTSGEQLPAEDVTDAVGGTADALGD